MAGSTVQGRKRPLWQVAGLAWIKIIVSLVLAVMALYFVLFSCNELRIVRLSNPCKEGGAVFHFTFGVRGSSIEFHLRTVGKNPRYDDHRKKSKEIEEYRMLSNIDDSTEKTNNPRTLHIMRSYVYV